MVIADVGNDDILDAFAALWTAERIFHGQARTLPDTPSQDAVSLRLEIVY
jgi:predicted RNase H-like nuclease